MRGEKFFAAREVLFHLRGVQSKANVDTIPREVWDDVRQALLERGMSHRAFAQAMNTKFCGSTMWKHSPSRSRLHRAAAVLEDRALHDLSKNDVFWDEIVEVTRTGRQDVYTVTVEDAECVIADGIFVHVSRCDGPVRRTVAANARADFACRNSRWRSK
jgi:replicative DNA helicase